MLKWKFFESGLHPLFHCKLEKKSLEVIYFFQYYKFVKLLSSSCNSFFFSNIYKTCLNGSGLLRATHLKPICYCDAKPFALGTFASPDAKGSTFVLPNAQNTNMLVSLALGNAHF